MNRTKGAVSYFQGKYLPPLMQNPVRSWYGKEIEALINKAKEIQIMAKAKVSKEKAKKILRHGEVKGHPLTEKQKGFFGARAGGSKKKK